MIKTKFSETSGVALITAERRRQIDELKWSALHDDKHWHGELATQAAICACDGTDAFVDNGELDDWGIIKKYGIAGKQPDPIRLLTIAGALIAAEIDRLIRATPQPKP